MQRNGSVVNPRCETAFAGGSPVALHIKEAQIEVRGRPHPNDAHDLAHRRQTFSDIFATNGILQRGLSFEFTFLDFGLGFLSPLAKKTLCFWIIIDFQ